MLELELGGIVSQLEAGLSVVVLKCLLFLNLFTLSFVLLKSDLDFLNFESTLLLLDGELLLVSELLLGCLTFSLEFIVLDRSQEGLRVDFIFSLSRNLFCFHSTLLSELGLQVGEKAP